MLPLLDVVEGILPSGTRKVNGPPLTTASISRVVVLTDDHQPVIDRTTIALVNGVNAHINATDFLSSAPAALVVPAEHEVPTFEVDYPILMLPPGADTLHIVETINARLREQQARLAIQGIDVYRQLAELAIAGKGLQGIAAAVAVLLSLPVAIADDEWRPICAFGIDGAPAPLPDDTLLSGLRTQLRSLLEHERLSSSAPPVLHVVVGGESQICVAAPIVLPTGPTGYLWVEATPATLFPLVDITVGHAAAVGAIEMARQQAVLEAQLHLRGNFVEELLTNSYRSIEAMRQRARFLGHDLDRPHVVAIFDIDHFARYITARPVSGEGAIVKLKERFTRLVAESLAAGDAALLWQTSDAVVVLLPLEAETAIADLTTMVETVRASVQSRLGGPSLSCGIGRIYSDAAQVHRSYVEAREAVRIGLTTTGAATTTTFDGLGVFRLLFRMRESPELASFCDELLGPLERYDRARSTDLVHTLERYLACNCNVARATEELHLHRNGLLYRLQRIAELTGADFNDARQRLSYHLALMGRSLEERD